MSTTLAALFEHAAGGPLPGWSQLAASCRMRRVPAAGVVFEQDAEEPHVFAVRSGLVALVYVQDDGTEWIKSFLDTGSYFASIAALAPGGRTSFMARALEPTVLESIDYRAIAALADVHLPWARALRELLWRFAMRKEQRERELLTLTAEQAYRALVREQPQLLARVSQKDLARYLGVTPVGLNRIAMRVRRATAR